MTTENAVVPLTTIWKPPPGCPSIVDFQSISQVDGTSTPIDHHCAPPDYENVWWRLGYYSPGICFSGYTIGCTGSGILNSVRIKATETAGLCVPIGYTCLPHFSDASLTNWGAISVVTVSSPIYFSPGSNLEVPAFQIRWAASDLPKLASSPSWSILTTSDGVVIPAPLTPSPSSSVSLPSATSGSSGSGSSGSSSPIHHKKSLPASAIAGIAVGVVLLLLLVLLGLFLILRRKKRGEIINDSDKFIATSGPSPPELEAKIAPTDQNNRTELDVAAALPGKHVPELSGEGTPVAEAYVCNKPQATASELQASHHAPETAGVTSPVSLVSEEKQMLASNEKEVVPVIQTHQQVPSPIDEERAELIRRQSELETRRQRLVELEQIDSEQRNIRDRLAQLK